MAGAAELAANWGWATPSEAILRLAEHSVAFQGDTAEALVRLNLVDAPSLARLKPRVSSNSDLLELAAADAPAKVQPSLEMVRALVHGYAYYENLGVLSQHASMTEPAVLRRCEELDCVLMLIEGERPVIVFPTFGAMLKYRISGRAEKADDALLRAAGGDLPLLAVGARDDISAIISQAGGKQEGAGSQNTNVWHSASLETKQHPAQRELARLLDSAIDNEASDIALQPQRDGSYRIYIRRWGALQVPRTADTWNPELAASIIEVLQSKSGANPSNTFYRTPRDGHISYRSPQGDAFLRLSFIPLNHLGEVKPKPSVSIRLFAHSESKIELASLKLEPEVVQAIGDAVRMPQGLILVAGPMNSGKSTTVAGALGCHLDVYGATKKRISVEQPIERFIAGVTQVQVPDVMLKASGEQVGDSERWDEILKGLKRHDGNTFWIGEVRDADTAAFCAQFSVSGHLVLSTIHARDSVLAFDVLSTMIREDLRFQLAEGMSLVVSQRLVPRLCPHCKSAGPVTSEERRQWSLYMDMSGESLELPGEVARATPHEDSDCEHCQDGYSGYAVVSEVLPFTRQVRDAAADLLARGTGAVAARKRMSDGRTLTLTACALRHLQRKDVDLASVLYL